MNNTNHAISLFFFSISFIGFYFELFIFRKLLSTMHASLCHMTLENICNRISSRLVYLYIYIYIERERERKREREGERYVYIYIIHIVFVNIQCVRWSLHSLNNIVDDPYYYVLHRYVYFHRSHYRCNHCPAYIITVYARHTLTQYYSKHEHLHIRLQSQWCLNWLQSDFYYIIYTRTILSIF
jgi:hypothetical protein